MIFQLLPFPLLRKAFIAVVAVAVVVVVLLLRFAINQQLESYRNWWHSTQECHNVWMYAVAAGSRHRCMLLLSSSLLLFLAVVQRKYIFCMHEFMLL